jgi:hypothetical protein
MIFPFTRVIGVNLESILVQIDIVNRKFQFDYFQYFSIFIASIQKQKIYTNAY